MNAPAAVMLLTGSPFVMDQTIAGALWLLVAAIVLDFFDISLPRGDSAGVGGALCAAAIVVVGPVRAGVIALLSAAIAHALRRGGGSPLRPAIVLVSRGVALAGASVLLLFYPRNAAPIGLYVAIPALFLCLELVVAQGIVAAFTGRPFARLLRGNLSAQTPLLAAQWSAAVLLLLTYSGMGSWSLIPVVALLLLMRQSYAMFLDIRETYRTTVEVLVEAAESQDSRRAGHADRTAAIARGIAMRIGLSAAEVEQISYAALLHDLGELAEAPTGDVPRTGGRAPAAEVVRDVDFFSGVQPILAVCDGSEEGVQSEETLLAGLVVALASDIDAEYHPDVAAAHDESAVARVSHRVTPAVKARAVGAALRLGYRIPAVG